MSAHRSLGDSSDTLRHTQSSLAESVHQMLMNQEALSKKQEEMDKKQDEILAMLKSAAEDRVRSGKSWKPYEANRKVNKSARSRDAMPEVDPATLGVIVEKSLAWYTEERGEMLMVRNHRTPDLTDLWLLKMRAVLSAEQFDSLDTLSKEDQELVYVNVAASVRSFTGNFSSKKNISSRNASNSSKPGATKSKSADSRTKKTIGASEEQSEDEVTNDETDIDVKVEDEERPKKRRRTAKSYKETTTLVLHDSGDSSHEEHEDEEIGENVDDAPDVKDEDEDAAREIKEEDD